ncbi:MAG: DUF1588 domain-containing protein [Planctomycetota bacterium]
MPGSAASNVHTGMRPPHCVLFIAMMLNTLSTPSALFGNDAMLEAGRQIYVRQCAQCHGTQGGGNDQFYPDPLIGDASIGELIEIIDDTMPEEDPEDCVGDDASAVAAYIHHAFYSEAARLRNRPPRQSLQRLTGAQLRQSLMDIYGRFAGTASTRWEVIRSQRGLKAFYEDGDRSKKDKQKMERIDPTIDFDFGLEGPGNGISGDQFRARWRGSLRVPETGRYQIVVRSRSSFVMTLGHDARELINNHVQSAGLVEFRRTRFLTSGRRYPIEIELHQRKRKTGAEPSDISLAWVRPGGVEEIVPACMLSPASVPDVLELNTVMPPDDNSYGFERGIRVDAAWDDAVTTAAIELANDLIDEAWPLYARRFRNKQASREEKLRQFIIDLVAHAFRCGAESTEVVSLAERALAYSDDEMDVIKLATLAAIKSPRFLYPTLDSDRPTSQRVANRLALILHDSLPTDRALLQAVDRDDLTNPNKLRVLASRLVDDARTRAKFGQWMRQWLGIEGEADLTKNANRYRGFDDAVVSDLRHSLDTFIDETVWSDASDYRQLMTADWMHTSQRLADYYGEAWDRADQGSSGWMTASVRDPSVHVGVLTHPLVLSNLAYFDTSSPIHRGVFLIRRVMGRTLRPPNEAFTPLSPDLHPDLTTRGRVELQTGSEGCQICHAKINPLGFALENYDASGRFRLFDRGHPIDASGTYQDRLGNIHRFEAARGLAEYVIQSPDAYTAFVRSLFQYFVKQPVASFGPDQLQTLTEGFRKSGFNIRDLLIEIAVVASSHPLPPSIDAA